MATTLLLVDDHAGFRARARALLEAEGFDVVGEAADGRTGLSIAGQLHPDVALVDLQLPDIDGFAVAAGLRSAASAGRIIIISGRDETEYRARVAESAADGFIAKADLSGDSVRAASA
ncbi:MAG TPA: response regulator transcription factor [Candidatus Limnocylindrales bacterium]